MKYSFFLSRVGVQNSLMGNKGAVLLR